MGTVPGCTKWMCVYMCINNLSCEFPKCVLFPKINRFQLTNPNTAMHIPSSEMRTPL